MPTTNIETMNDCCNCGDSTTIAIYKEGKVYCLNCYELEFEQDKKPEDKIITLQLTIHELGDIIKNAYKQGSTTWSEKEVFEYTKSVLENIMLNEIKKKIREETKKQHEKHLY